MFSILKIENFNGKIFDIFNNFTRRGGSNEYAQSLLWIENKNNKYTPANPIFLYKSGEDSMRYCVESVGPIFNDVSPSHRNLI